MRRHLGMSADEWRRVPWWERRVLMEGLEQEFGQGEGGAAHETPASSHHQAVDPFADDMFAGLGVKPQRLP